MEQKNILTQAVVGMGTNSRQDEMMARAKELMEKEFQVVAFSHEAYTDPIGISSDKFLNCLALISTSLSADDVNRRLKAIETACGNTSALRRKHVVRMDLDLLLYGSIRLHTADWQRPYVAEMMADLTAFCHKKDNIILL